MPTNFSLFFFPLFLCLIRQARPGVDQQIAVLHELNTALTMASGHPSQNRVGGVIQTLVPLLSVANNEVGVVGIRDWGGLFQFRLLLVGYPLIYLSYRGPKPKQEP